MNGYKNDPTKGAVAQYEGMDDFNMPERAHALCVVALETAVGTSSPLPRDHA